MWRKWFNNFRTVMIVVFLIAFLVEGWRVFTAPSFTKPHAAIDCVFAFYFSTDLIEKQSRDKTPATLVSELMIVICLAAMVGFIAASIS